MTMKAGARLRGSICVAAATSFALCVAAGAQQERAGSRRVYARPIVTTGPGPQRLAVDVDLLANAAPFEEIRQSGDERRAHRGLSDLRLTDGAGREVQYLLIHAPDRRRELLPASVLATRTTEKTSGFEADLGAAAFVDRLHVEGLPAPFLKRLVLEGSGDRAHWTLLAGEATLFDLPDERIRQVYVPFVPGDYRYLRVTWNDANSGRVPLPTRVLASRAPAGGSQPALVVEARMERRPSEPGRSRYRLTLPAARLPLVALTLDADGGHVFRDAFVRESRFSGTEASPVELGRATIARVVRDGVSASALRIPIQPPREAQLDLIIEDGSNPPLDITRAAFETATLPWIYFEAAASPIVASFGSRGSAPAYDLEAARGTVALASVPVARWGGEPRPTVAPPVEPRPAAQIAQTGAPIDPALFTYRRAIAAFSPGLSALPLDAAVLAHSVSSRGSSGGRFDDVRIVDADGRQVPYILERLDEPLSISVPLAAAKPDAVKDPSWAGRNLSAYAITAPYEYLPAARLVLYTSDRVFQRTLMLGTEQAADREHRGPWFHASEHARWAHADPGTDAPPLEMAFPRGQARALLIVDEGDNRPLTLTSARLLLPAWRLRFYSSGAALTLVYGNGTVDPPRYDLALLAPQVMGEAAREVGAAPEDATAGNPPAPLISPRAFWIALAVAAFVILGLIARLVTTSTSEDQPRPSPPAP